MWRHLSKSFGTTNQQSESLRHLVTTFGTRAFDYNFCFHLQGFFFHICILKCSDLKISLKMEAKILVEIFPEDGSKILVELPSSESCQQMVRAFTFLVCSSKKFRKMAPHFSTQICQQMALTSIFFL
jgi:hypothetical protein